jgi:hypothetical protein
MRIVYICVLRRVNLTMAVRQFATAVERRSARSGRARFAPMRRKQPVGASASVGLEHTAPQFAQVPVVGDLRLQRPDWRVASVCRARDGSRSTRSRLRLDPGKVFRSQALLPSAALPAPRIRATRRRGTITRRFRLHPVNSNPLDSPCQSPPTRRPIVPSGQWVDVPFQVRRLPQLR